MNLKFCSCRACRRYRKTGLHQAMIRRRIRGNRTATKAALRCGKPTTQTVSVPYTD